MGRPGFAMIILSLTVGCASTSNYTPTPVPIAEGSALNEFRTSTSVALVNGASDSDTKEWTAVAVTFLSRQLEQRGATIAGGAARQLMLEVVNVRRKTKGTGIAPLITTAAGVKEDCQIVVQARTGDGYAKVDTVSAGAYTWQKACDQVVTTAVVGILNDPTVRGYLTLADLGNVPPKGT